MSIVPIVFSVNNKYVPYLAVTLHSLEDHVSYNNHYKIHILYTDLNDYNRRRIKRLVKHINIEIEFINVIPFFSEYQLITVGHLTPETTYRIICGLLFSQYDKVLYLDSDVIVRDDVAVLYDTDIGGAYLGAARSCLTTYVFNYVRKFFFIAPTDYFNAGVLLINTKLFREKNIAEQGLNMLSGNHPYKTQDQDVLNILCHGHVFYLHKSWNAEWLPILDQGCSEEERQWCVENIPKANIVHYSSPTKPWNHPQLPYANIFWREARHTEFYEEINFLMMNHMVEDNVRQIVMAQRFLFPWGKIPEGTKIVIYGAGTMGKNYLWQLKHYSYCQVVAVCDQDTTRIWHEGIPLLSPTEISSINDKYDYIIVAVYSELMAKEIGYNLISLGIPQEKLIHIGCSFCER